MNKLIQEWLERADGDLREAKFLLRHKRPSHNTAFLIQQAAEKYLKAFLLKHGWELEKIHILEKLLKDAAKIDVTFSIFAEPLRKISRFYFESRYPVGYSVVYSAAEIKESLKVVEELSKLVKKKFGIR